MRDFYLCYPAILTNTLVPQLGLSSILQNQLGVALDALTRRRKDKELGGKAPEVQVLRYTVTPGTTVERSTDPAQTNVTFAVPLFQIRRLL